MADFRAGYRWKHSCPLKKQHYLRFCSLRQHYKWFQTPCFAVLHSWPPTAPSSPGKLSPASGSAPPCESEHVGADECASLRARMMRRCIYISLVKQGRWHAAIAGAQSMQPEHLVGFLLTSVAARPAFWQTHRRRTGRETNWHAVRS